MLGHFKITKCMAIKHRYAYKHCAVNLTVCVCCYFPGVHDLDVYVSSACALDVSLQCVMLMATAFVSSELHCLLNSFNRLWAQITHCARTQ